MTEIDFGYFNYEHFGRRSTGADVDAADAGAAYDYGRLCRVVGHDGRWPDVLIVGEADRCDFNGGEGLWEAASAMRAAGGRSYTPLMCSLPRDWGPFAPAMFVDTQTIQVRRFYDHRLPDFADRNRNTLRACLPGRDDVFVVATGHGDMDGDMRLADAKKLRPKANPSVPCIIGMDWNSTPSGPMWEPHDLDDREMWPHTRLIAHRVLWTHGPGQAGPYRADTRALDYLCGYWHEDKRLGGIGFHWVGELAGDTTPTNLPRPNGRQSTQIDGFVVNDAWVDRIVKDSFLVQPSIDPTRPDSDHLMVRVAVDV